MDYRPNYYSNRNAVDKSNRYKKKKIFWLNSSFNSDFVLIDNKIYEISFDIPPFEIFKNNRLKLLTYIRDSNQSKPIQIKLKLPLTQSRDIINTDKESSPIIYTNHTGVEMMTSAFNPIIRLIPQQISRFTFRLDDNINSILGSSGSDVVYRIFNYTGSIQTFNIPNGVSSINVYCWGAGGGSSRAENNTTTIRGGNGGFVKATLIIPSGISSLGVIVGQGGSKGSITGAETTRTAFGGGGAGVNNYIGWGLGGGGGLSGVFINDANFSIIGGYYVNTSATAIIIAGGGGGAGGYSVETGDTHGGNGGSTNANDGSGNRPGGGGTQISGGTAGTANGYAQGVSGSKYLGGNGTVGSFNPGGGGGYFGGGAGGVEAGKVSGGGGGSSFVNTVSYKITNITNLKNETNGTVYVIGNNETYYQSPIAQGGLTANSSTVTNDGFNGLVVIEYFRSRIEGITPEETLIQATNNSITVNTDSKYVINYQNPVNIPKGTYETIFANGSILFRNKKFPRPWGAYFAEDWSGTTLLDSSGNGRHATTGGTITKTSGFGNGANGNINYLTGTTTSTISFPNGSIPSTFTILGLTRYNGGSRFRILQARHPTFPSPNWLLGHYGGSRGFCYFEGWITQTSIAGNVDDWLCIIGKNSGTTPNNILANGNGIGTATGGNGGYNLGINLSLQWAETSDWAMSVVLIWDSALSDAQMFELNRLIDDYKNTGRSIKNDLGLNFDYSYPILKDANNTTINPLVWYQFDTSGNLGSDSMGIHNLTNPNGVAFSTDYVKGNGSASFDGVNDHLIKDGAFNLNSKNFSITFWIKKTDNARIDRFFQLGTGLAANTSMYLLYGNDNKIVFGNYAQDLVSASAYTDGGNWVHLCFTYLTGTKTAIIYRNGVNIAQMNFTNEFNTNNDIRIGSFSGANYYKGLMDDFRIYESVLTATQVSELYNGRVSIYNPPAFLTGFELEDEDLIKENTISSYK